jgi:hypothetical protein
MILIRQEYSCGDVALLFEAIDNLPTEQRDEITQLFEDDSGPLRLLVTMPWAREESRTEPDYEACLSDLHEALAIAKSWPVRHWRRSVVRAIATVLDESLHRPHDALTLLEEEAAITGWTPALEDCRARVIFSQGRFQECLDIWKRVLPKWLSNTDDAPTLAARKAGIAAAMLSRWAEASDLFREAARRAASTGPELLAHALMADAAFASWKAGSTVEALNVFHEVVAYLETLPQSSTQLREYWLHKIVGHMLAWCAQGDASELEEPPAGSASNPVPDPRVLELPPTPIDGTKLLLLQCAAAVPGWSRVLEISEALLSSTEPSFVLLAAHHRILRAIEDESYEDLLSITTRFLQAANQVDVADLDDKGIEGPMDATSAARFAILLLVLGLAKAIISRSRDQIVFLVDEWNRASQQSDTSAVRGFVQRIRELLLEEPTSLRRTMVDAQVEYWEQIIAGLLLCRYHDFTPAELFRVQVGVVLRLGNNPQTEQVLRSAVAKWVRETWSMAGNWRIQLHAPNTTVGEILEAVNNAGNDWPSTCRILLAAKSGVGARIPATVHDALVRIRDGNGERPGPS